MATVVVESDKFGEATDYLVGDFNEYDEKWIARSEDGILFALAFESRWSFGEIDPIPIVWLDTHQASRLERLWFIKHVEMPNGMPLTKFEHNGEQRLVMLFTTA